MSFWDDVVAFTSETVDDVTSYGAGVLDDVGESMSSLFSFEGAANSNTNHSANPAATVQADAPSADRHGNAVTVPQGGYRGSSGQWVQGVSNGVVIGVSVGAVLLGVLALRK